MNYEEKIRLAKEALNSGSYDKETIEYIFPELVESEDERVRNFLIGYFDKLVDENSEWGLTKETRSRIITWLEKQSAQIDLEEKDIWEYIQEFIDKFGHFPKDCDELNVCINYVLGKTKHYVNQKELKKIEKEIEIPFGAKDSELQEVTYYIPKGFHAEIDDDKVVIKKGKQKLTDEEMKEALRTEYEKGRADAIAEMQKEWSEEDEKFINGIETYLLAYKINVIDDDKELVNYIEKEINWLKFLKDRYTWKPSDEQIKALEHFVRSIGESGYASPYDNNTKLLYSLLSDLKKLKS